MRHWSLAHHLLTAEVAGQVRQVRSRFDERLVEGLDWQGSRDSGPVAIAFPGRVGRVELLDVDLHWVRS